jgi:hypothetical protein
MNGVTQNRVVSDKWLRHLLKALWRRTLGPSDESDDGLYQRHYRESFSVTL